MKQPEPQPAGHENRAAVEATLPEDLLLLLFQPASGTIAGETTLAYVLAGAVLADLAIAGRVTTSAGRTGAVRVEVVEGSAPADEILRSAWDYLAAKTRGVQTALAAIGPPLREPLLARLIARGDIRKESRRAFGLFPTTALNDGWNGRRAALLGQLRGVLVDGEEPTPRIAALAALVWGSGTLPHFHREIPWSSAVIARAQELQGGNWGASAAADAVARTMTAIIAGSVIAATTASPQN